MTTSDTSDDPFADHFRRDPLPEAGIRVIFLTDLPAESADAIVAPLIDMIAAWDVKSSAGSFRFEKRAWGVH